MSSSKGLLWELVDWHEFNCSDAKTFEIRYFFNDSKVRPRVFDAT